MSKFGDIFEGSGLDGMNDNRLDPAFLLSTATSESARFLPFYNNNPLFLVEKLGTLSTFKTSFSFKRFQTPSRIDKRC
jgi:hypothetical protein